jgi:hypothetical protein
VSKAKVGPSAEAGGAAAEVARALHWEAAAAARPSHDRTDMDTLHMDRRAARRPDAVARRTRLRLRELCDEVLASYRVATDRDPLTPSDREAARSLLARVTPRLPMW